MGNEYYEYCCICNKILHKTYQNCDICGKNICGNCPSFIYEYNKNVYNCLDCLYLKRKN